MQYTCCFEEQDTNGKAKKQLTEEEIKDSDITTKQLCTSVDERDTAKTKLAEYNAHQGEREGLRTRQVKKIYKKDEGRFKIPFL